MRHLVTRTYRRTELYELVWSKPMYQAAKDCGVSDVALRKICRALKVPIPSRGHWLRAEADREPRPALPASSSDLYTRVRRGGTPPRPEPSADARTNAAARVAETLVIDSVLTKPHALVADARKRLSRSSSMDGVLDTDDGLAICVSPANVSRALRIMDALLKSLEALGHEVALRNVPLHAHWSPERERVATMVRVEGEWIEFSLHESLRRDPLPADMSAAERWSRKPGRVGRPRRPTGNLALTIDDDHEPGYWRDRSKRKVEDFLKEFVAHLYVVASSRREQRTLREQEQSRQQEAARRAEEAQQRAAEERRRIDVLHENMKRWCFARDIREYAKAVSSIPRPRKAGKQWDAIWEYLGWVLEYADRIDPTKQNEIAT